MKIQNETHVCTWHNDNISEINERNLLDCRTSRRSRLTSSITKYFICH